MTKDEHHQMGVELSHSHTRVRAITKIYETITYIKQCLHILIIILVEFNLNN
jgi:hypothetical protein